MKLLVLAAIIAIVASSPVSENQKWPWQVGKVYRYDVDTYTWTKFEESINNGNVFKAQFVVRVKAPGKLLAKLENPLYAQLQAKVLDNTLPSDLKYQPIEKIDQPFEILVDGGRVLSLNLPSSFSLAYENLIKGLVSALQVDLSTFGHKHDYPNSFDQESFQGLFKKTEADVTGDCETLYSVSPVSAEWRRELPKFASEEAPVEIIKTKNYDTCQKRAAYYYGVDTTENQLVKYTSESRILAGKQGTIYKSEFVSSVFVTPLLFGKQKAEVYSAVKFFLSSVEQDSGAEWLLSEKVKPIASLLYTLDEFTFYTKASEETIVNAQKLLQEITPLLQEPNTLSKSDFFSKFTILSRLISSLNTEQLDKLTSSVEVAKSSKNAAKARMWIVYRDAVAQAGSFAAFRQIKSWVSTKKIQGEEAAEAFASIASSLLYATKPILEEFLNFALSPEVAEQKFLNTTALLAVAKVARLSKDDEYITGTIIPRFAKELKEAVEKGDSKNTQAYIRVLGQLAHPDVIKVFAPYLEGQYKVTKYMRIQFVTDLKKLANTKNESVQAVLFSILRNTAEPYEVRVAAALNIFLTFPSAEMFQVLAQITNYDPSTQVRAVLANGINFAAGLKDPRFAELAKNAAAVKDLVAKEKFGFRYSTDSLIDLYTGEDDGAFFRELSYIGSGDNYFPVYHRTALRPRSTAGTEESMFTYSVSGAQLIWDLILNTKNTKVGNSDFKYSAKKIAELLNIQRSPLEYVEGSIFFDVWNQERLFTFTEEELYALREGSDDLIKSIIFGSNGSYTKITNQKQVWIVFPLAAGFPFVYDYNEPILLDFEGKVNLNKPENVNLNLELRVNYARNLDGRVGFFDTLSDVYASAGVVNKLQLYIPAKLLVAYRDVKLTFFLPERDTNVIQYSVLPYTSTHKKDSVLSTFENPATKLIERLTKVVSTDVKVGYWSGTAYNVKGYSYSSDYKNFASLFGADLLKNVFSLLYQKDVALTEYTFKYLAESKNKVIIFTPSTSTLYNQNEAGDLGDAPETNDLPLSSEARTEILAKKVAAGIKSATVSALDLSLVFDGQQKTEFVFTGALADSFVDSKVQGGFLFKGCEQTNAVFKLIKPKIVPLDFEEALKNEIKINYEADIKSGSKFNLQTKGYGERSERYTEQLKNDPIAKRCLNDYSKKNFYQLDCYKAIMKAHAPDFFKATGTYKNFTPAQLDLAYSSYDLFDRLFPSINQEDLLKTTAEGTVEFEADAFYYDNYVDLQFITKYGVLNLKNIAGLGYYPYGAAVYAPATAWERSLNYYHGYQHMPYCAVDTSKVYTFGGRSYDYTLTGSWHVVAVDEAATWDDLVILARRPSENQEEVYISYKFPSGSYIEAEIKPDGVSVKSNVNKTSDGPVTTYSDVVPFFEYYDLADGVKVFNIKNGQIRIVYDSERLIIFTDQHRSTIRGLCGQSTGQARDDYLTPFGLVDLPEYYGASFSLDGEFSDPKTVELKKEAKLKAYQPETKYTKILRSDAEWTKAMNRSVKGF